MHKNGKGLCVDVGVWVGWTTIPMAYAGCDVISVDTFKAKDTYTGQAALNRFKEFEKMNEQPDCYEIFLRNLELSKVRERVTPIKGDSVEAALAILHRCIAIGGFETADLVFIDADHSHHAVMQDLLKWQHILKPGGLLCGHDRNLVSEAVKQFLAPKDWGFFKGGPDQIWWVRKQE
jgi:SAM-dependent methyltransferase